MELWRSLLVFLGCLCILAVGSAMDEAGMLEDNEFAEFEQFDTDEDIVVNTPPNTGGQPQFANVDESDEDMLVEDEENEFEHFQDPEEFEGFADELPNPAQEQPKITITKMPIMVRARWEAYWMEGLLALGLALYAVNFLAGRSKNLSIASAFSAIHKPLLQENFTLVGEEGGEAGGWKKEAEHCYTMWCSGRTCCEGMLLTLKLIKRQDLVHLGIGLLRPSFDSVVIKVIMSKEDLDNIVFCVAQKKTAVKLSKEMQDLSVFCGERRPGDKFGLPESFSVLCEQNEPCQALMDTRVCTALHRYGHLIDFIHISDQYSGPKPTEETASTKLPECQRVMIFSLILPVAVTSVEGACEAMKPMMALIFYMLEKVKRYNLSSETAMKAQRNRQNVEEAFLKSTHAARQQMAAQKREDKRRQEKDRIMAEEDPEKQRRWEKKELKRQLKKKTPKMKQLKVKSM